MKLYKATGISGAAAFVCAAIALYLNPMKGKSIAPPIVSSAMLIAAVAMIAIFIVVLAITLIHHKVESKAEGGVRGGVDLSFKVLTRAGKYDETIDRAEQARKANKEKHKLD